MKYLALGDSYTIGELVDFKDNFPSQLIFILKEKGIDINLDKLIAVTGWTTDELANEIAIQKPNLDYDLVTLLIGVNNQYRGRNKVEYYWQFYSLLCQAILFAKGNPKNVVVLSIPDWGLTPYNIEKDKTEISIQIDDYNKINKEISNYFGCKYVDVTTSSRDHATNEIYLASDKLHYSKEEYKIWASIIANCNY